QCQQTIDALVRLAQVGGRQIHALGQLAELGKRRVAGFQVVGSRLRNGIDLPAHGVEGVVRTNDDTLDLLGAGAGMSGMFARFAALVDETFDLVAERAHNVADPISRGAGLFSEALDLTRDDGKAASRFAGAGRLDARI